jgi:cytochrome d ubiquinol oxidase subunit II
VIAIYALFPGAAYTLGTVLFIPGSIILLLLALRSAFLVFSHVATDYSKILTYISGITGLLIPALLISVLPITHGNYVEGTVGSESLNFGKLFTSPHEYAFIGFAIFSSLFLSSLLLSDYSKESNEIEAFKIYRKNAMITGPISLVMAFLIMITMKNEANWIYTNMMENLGLLLLSLVFFFIGGVALYFPYFSKKEIKGMPRLAVISIVIQYFIASFVYAEGHLPYMVYPIVTIESGFTDPASFRAVFATYIVGFVILFPGFVFFWRMFMKDKKYLRKNHEGH